MTCTSAPPLPFKVPKELYRFVDFLCQNALDDEGILREGGETEEIDAIREAIDTNSPFPENVSNSSIGEAFLSFLESLAEPIIPAKFYRLCIKSVLNRSACENIMEKIPTVHRNCFHYVMSFLRLVLQHGNTNAHSVETLAVICSTFILRPMEAHAKGLTANDEMLEQNARVVFLMHFLKHDYPLKVMLS